MMCQHAPIVITAIYHIIINLFQVKLHLIPGLNGASYKYTIFIVMDSLASFIITQLNAITS